MSESLSAELFSPPQRAAEASSAELTDEQPLDSGHLDLGAPEALELSVPSADPADWPEVLGHWPEDLRPGLLALQAELDAVLALGSDWLGPHSEWRLGVRGESLVLSGQDSAGRRWAVDQRHWAELTELAADPMWDQAPAARRHDALQEFRPSRLEAVRDARLRLAGRGLAGDEHVPHAAPARTTHLAGLTERLLARQTLSGLRLNDTERNLAALSRGMGIGASALISVMALATGSKMLHLAPDFTYSAMIMGITLVMGGFGTAALRRHDGARFTLGATLVAGFLLSFNFASHWSSAAIQAAQATPAATAATQLATEAGSMNGVYAVIMVLFGLAIACTIGLVVSGNRFGKSRFIQGGIGPLEWRRPVPEMGASRDRLRAAARHWRPDLKADVWAGVELDPEAKQGEETEAQQGGAPESSQTARHAPSTQGGQTAPHALPASTGGQALSVDEALGLNETTLTERSEALRVKAAAGRSLK